MQSEKARADVIGSLHSAEAIHEMLRRPPRGLVQLCDAVQQTELRAELAVQIFCVVANDIQTAALLRPIQAECGDDDVTAQPNCAGDLTGDDMAERKAMAGELIELLGRALR